MKHEISIVAFCLSMLLSLPTLGISRKLERAHLAAQKSRSEVHLVLTPAQSEWLRVIVLLTLVSTYMLPLGFLYSLHRDEKKPGAAPDPSVKLLPPARDISRADEEELNAPEDDFTR